MRRVVHIIGNGNSSWLYNEKERKGLKLGCNQIGFEIQDKFASCIVDYKFMQAMTAGQIVLPGRWILGFNKIKADEIHLYGFDSIFDFNLTSLSDVSLNSDRGNSNNLRLSDNWRPIWQNMFREFSNTKFVLHYFHDKLKINIENNVDVVVYKSKLNELSNKEKLTNADFQSLTE